MLDLRMRAQKRPGVTTALGTESMSRFRATMIFMQNALIEDVDEPLYPIPNPVDEEWVDYSEVSGEEHGS